MILTKPLLLSREMLGKILNVPDGVEIASARMTDAGAVELMMVDPKGALPEGEFGYRVFEADGNFGVSLKTPVAMPQKGATRGSK